MRKPSQIWAAIDIGSNTIHLVVKQLHQSRLEMIRRHSEMLSLGRDVARTGKIGAAEPRRAISGLRRLLLLARQSAASVVLIGATEALRQAGNGKDFIRQISDTLSLPVRLISKTREESLSFLGARNELPAKGPQIFVDSGGGSTEVCLCQGHRLVKAVSLPIGSGMLSWDLTFDPPEPLDLVRVTKPILSSLSKLPRNFAPKRALATGGAAHNLIRISQTNGQELSAAELNRALHKLLKHPSRDIARKFQIDAQRARTLAPGAIILGSILEDYSLDRFTVVKGGVRDGMLEAYRQKGESWWKE